MYMENPYKKGLFLCCRLLFRKLRCAVCAACCIDRNLRLAERTDLCCRSCLLSRFFLLQIAELVDALNNQEYTECNDDEVDDCNKECSDSQNNCFLNNRTCLIKYFRFKDDVQF